MKKQAPTSAALLLLPTASGLAGPVTTVPWNGHPGAVSFTFDDGVQSKVILPMGLPHQVHVVQVQDLGASGWISVAPSLP